MTDAAARRALIALVGLHGAGKTTMARELESAGHAVWLRPFTTRLPRQNEPDEYTFLTDAQVCSAEALWIYPKSGVLYGLTAVEAMRTPIGGVGVVAAHLEALDAIRSATWGGPIIVVGLDTIDSAEAQFDRVGRIATRAQDREVIDHGRRQMADLATTLTGGQPDVFAKLIEFTQLVRAAL